MTGQFYIGVGVGLSLAGVLLLAFLLLPFDLVAKWL